MALFDQIYQRATSATARKADPPRQPVRLTGSPDEKWKIPGGETAERQATLYANLNAIQVAVANVAESFATTPFRVAALRAEAERGIVNHPFELLLRRPNPDQSRFELLRDTVAWYKITGSCTWWLNRPTPDAPPEEIWIIPTPMIVPIPDGYGSVRGYRYTPGPGVPPLLLDRGEVVYFKTFNPLSRYAGLSAVQALAVDSTADLAAQRYNAAFYDKDNAKPAGMLMFADDVPEPAWKRLHADMEQQTGGTKGKRMMLLRNVGAGGVQYVMTQMSRQDMEYLAGRTYTAEQIYARLAPGLASILAVNATEANSTAGKDTFRELAIYPLHVAVAEKIVNDLLPIYGEDLTGAFDDVRRVDTQVELAARTAYERTHTVDEVRAKYDGDGPIGDARGALLPAQAANLAPPSEPGPALGDVALLAAQKAHERRQWRTKALKAQAAGRNVDVAFTPEHLGDDEAMEIRAALRRGDVGAAFDGR